MYKLIDYDEREKWQEVIKSFKYSDIYFQWGYIKPFKIHGDGEPFLFYYSDENGRAANVFFLRDVSKAEGLRGKVDCNRYFDICSAYGYGGLLYEGTNLDKLAFNYSGVFNQYCLENNIISEFIRFNPLIENHKFLVNVYNIMPARKTVYIDLSKGEEFVWANLKNKNRNAIRKAMKYQIEIINGRSTELIEKLIELYKETMDREHADQYYYFEKEFFYDTLDELSENSTIFAARYNNKIISAFLILYNERYAHYHLGGNNEEAMYLHANNLLLYEASKWALERGISGFHLGGGHSDCNDNLFRFKKTFSQSEPLNFYIGKKIHDEQAYNDLINIRKKTDIRFDDSSEYFPKYRG
jgi:hypothetical protein